ncbi:MAG: methyl-accepting chemotaxis protein [Deltaproteobacteria bacterium]|nr:methyl-accepting chemotaxis protein [Deltaproteobacteria bacterium]
MRISYKKSFLVHLLVPTIILFTIGLTCLGSVLISAQKKSVRSISDQIHNLSQQNLTELKRELSAIGREQVELTKTSLRNKTAHLAELLAGFSAPLIAEFDFERLNIFAEQTSKDPDILLVYMNDAENEIISSFKNEKDPVLLELVPEAGKLELKALIRKLEKQPSVLSVKHEISQDGERLGTVIILFTEASAIRQAENIDKRFNQITKAAVLRTDSMIKKIVSQAETAIARSTGLGIGLGAACLIVIILILTWAIKKRISSVVKCGEMINQMAEGRFTTQLEISREDEIGRMIKAANEMSQQLRGMILEISHNSIELEEASEKLSTIAAQISSGASSTMEKSNDVGAASEEMRQNMNSIAAAMEETSVNISTIASSTKQLNESIADIVNQMEQTRERTLKAVNLTSKTFDNVHKLGDAAENIGTVIETINSISQKTNLLALNATIEAARAGEAGKGFAVVANEIKDLANQTADATVDISHKLEDIQLSTTTTTADIGELSQVINDVSEIVVSINETLNLQNSTTLEINENINQASLTVQEINENVSQASLVVSRVAEEIVEVGSSAQEMSNACEILEMSAEELNNMATQLKKKMTRFEV